MLARPYLMTLYTIFSIHLNFPVRSRCVLKGWIIEKNDGLLYSYLRKLTRLLARPYLMLLYSIFPIHLNFPIRSWCDLKGSLIEKKWWIVLQLLEKVFSFSKGQFSYCTCMRYLNNFFWNNLNIWKNLLSF